jgi:hypothetical protein
MEKSYTADSFKINGGLGTKILLDNGTTTDYVSGGTDTYVTGGTYDNNVLTLNNNINSNILITGITDTLKLDSGSYSGTGFDLDNRLSVIEQVQNLESNFTGQAFAIWTGVGLEFNVIYPDYYINNILYSGDTQPITLDPSDLTYSRLDVIGVDASGAIKITGVAEENPVIPTVDPYSQLLITTILISANATTPEEITEEVIYKENLEWSGSSNNGTVNFSATTTPFQGSYHIDCGAFTNSQYLRFTDNVVNEITDYSMLNLSVNLKSTFSNNTRFSVQFYNGTTLISSTLQITSGKYNFTRTTVGAYQLLTVPFSDFTFTNSSFNRVEIVLNGSNTSGFVMDNIILSKGNSVVTPQQNTITSIITNNGIVNATVPNDVIQIVGSGSTIVSSIGKIITITSSGGTGTDIRVTGGTYSSGTAIFTNNTGGTFNVTGFSTGGTSPITIVNTSSLFSTGLVGAGIGSTANNSNFFGDSAGYQATTASNSNFLGYQAGYSATNASNSIFIGSYAGYQATFGSDSNFIGSSAGYQATNASLSNFFGPNAGYQAIDAFESNFIGIDAGGLATNSSNANFIGHLAGYNASSASYSNFIGYNAGNGATSAYFSNFIGYNAGNGTTNGTYSNLFGYNVGKQFTSNNIGSNNIIIGTNISLPDGTINGINLGGVLFGSGTYSNVGGDPNITGQTTGKIGINVVNPTTALHIYSSSANTSGLRLERLTSSSPTSIGQALGVDAGGNVITIIGGSDTYVTGGTYSNGTAIFTNSTGGTFNVTGFSTGSTSGATSPITIVNTSSLFSTGLSGTGYLATGATNSNFFGVFAGSGATNGYDSNFFGYQAGIGGVNTWDSNFFGYQAGSGATGANGSNFFGYQAGIGGINAGASNFMGTQAGYKATGATWSNFIGFNAGYSATNATYSNFIGQSAGNYATNANKSNFIGGSAGNYATNANDSNFMGYSAGDNATNASYSNFMGNSAGYQGTNAGYSNFFGYNAGYQATSSWYSNFFGYYAGRQSTGATYSNFLGWSAGQNASNATYSNFLGYNAGNSASNAQQSNFFGLGAGQNASNANGSNFLGKDAGNSATSASGSTFMGNSAGYRATGASYSTLIGSKAGWASSTSVSIGSNNIIIGTNISLPSGTTNSINLGGVLFGTGTYSTTAGTPSISGQTIGKIGINVVNPTANLHVAASTTANALMRLGVGSAPSSPNNGDIWLEDETLTGLKIRLSGVTRTIAIS